MTSPTPTSGGLELKTTSGGFTLSFRGRVVIRHSIGSAAFSLGAGKGSFRMSHGNFRISDALKRRIPCSRHLVQQEGARVKLSFADAPLRVAFSEAAGRLVMAFQCDDPQINRLWLRLEGSPHEHIYGCGEQYSRLDLKGSRVPLWVSEQGVGRGHNLVTLAANLHSHSGGSWCTTYFPVPAFFSTDNWYCACEISSWAGFDFRSADSTWLEFWELPRRIDVGVASSPAEALEGLSALLGRQPPPPEWLYDGMVLGVQGGRESVERKLHDALDAGVRVSALWVQDWEGKRETSFGRQLKWDWIFDPESYPELPAQIAELRNRGIRFLGYLNPFLVPEGTLYREASERGLLVRNRRGGDYLVTVTSFPAALLDLTNPEAVDWIKGVIRTNMIDIGLSGWMADYGEYLPADAVLYSGEPAELVHNRYPVLWAKANREAVEESGKLGELFFFMRSGYLGSTRHATGYWAGDQMVDFSRHDGLPSVIPAALSLGFGSVGIWHAEIGGFTSLFGVKRTEELFLRWAELAAFSPIMRTHEGNRPDTNWQFNSSARTLSHLARMTRVYTGLRPYHRALIQEYLDSGLPPMRHPCLHYPGDEGLHRRRDQYLYGRDLLVAPTVEAKAGARRVYLPDDRWRHLWSGREYARGRHTIRTPFGEPAVFYRSDSAYRPLFEEIGAGIVVDNRTKVP